MHVAEQVLRKRQKTKRVNNYLPKHLVVLIHSLLENASQALYTSFIKIKNGH